MGNKDNVKINEKGNLLMVVLSPGDRALLFCIILLLILILFK